MSARVDARGPARPRPRRGSLRASALAALLAHAAVALTGCVDEADAARGYVAATVADDARARAASTPSAQRGALIAMLEREVPAGVAAADAGVIRRDACERLARLELREGALDEADRWLARGLAFEAPEDVFAANLWTTRGRLREAQGRDADAAADYHRALVIEEALLDAALGEPGEEP